MNRTVEEILKQYGLSLLQEVTVLDVSNYRSSYAEKTPFKGVLYEVTDYPCFWVRSLVTGKEYELYDVQVLEIEGNPEDY